MPSRYPGSKPIGHEEAVQAVYKTREETKGLEMIYEPDYLRFFQARFKKIK